MTRLSRLQKLVAKHYCGGEFAHIKTVEEAGEVGDTLFLFCIVEAGDMSGPHDLAAALDRAVRELRSLAGELE